MHVWLLIASASAADLPFSTVGCNALDGLSELRFTFNVETSGELKLSRSWVYEPATRTVTRTVDGASTTFTFGSPRDGPQTQADAQFINDSFWLLPTCHMAWATDVTVTPVGERTIPVAPVGKPPGRAPMVTVQYDPNGGGYTPGDAYNLYLGSDRELVAWSYRRRGVDDPTLSTTFTDYVQAGPLRIATEHLSADGEFRLFFTKVVATP